MIMDWIEQLIATATTRLKIVAKRVFFDHASKSSWGSEDTHSIGASLVYDHAKECAEKTFVDGVDEENHFQRARTMFETTKLW